MSNVDIFVSQQLQLTFKQGKETANGTFSIISKAADGRIVLLLMDHENTAKVTDGTTWLCEVEMIFPKKIIVRAIQKL